MASSDTRSIESNISVVQLLNPGSILDIGLGFGKYGFLCREYLSDSDAFWGKSKIVIDGVEGYKDNINTIQYEMYNNIFICNAVDTDKYLTKEYDLVLLLDVFEHFEKKDGINLLNNLRKKCRFILINIPRYCTAQRGYDADINKYEKHRSFWTTKELKQIGGCLIIPNRANKTIALFFNGLDNSVPESVFAYKKWQMIAKFIPHVLVDALNFLKWFIKRNSKDLYLSRK